MQMLLDYSWYPGKEGFSLLASYFHSIKAASLNVWQWCKEVAVGVT
jgi:hypothetical protein